MHVCDLWVIFHFSSFSSPPSLALHINSHAVAFRLPCIADQFDPQQNDETVETETETENESCTALA